MFIEGTWQIRADSVFLYAVVCLACLQAPSPRLETTKEEVFSDLRVLDEDLKESELLSLHEQLGRI
jgi:hypothetical protein